jgi:hypothetical protein
MKETFARPALRVTENQEISALSVGVPQLFGLFSSLELFYFWDLSFSQSGQF